MHFIYQGSARRNDAWISEQEIVTSRSRSYPGLTGLFINYIFMIQKTPVFKLMLFGDLERDNAIKYFFLLYFQTVHPEHCTAS